VRLPQKKKKQGEDQRSRFMFSSDVEFCLHLQKLTVQIVYEITHDVYSRALKKISCKTALNLSAKKFVGSRVLDDHRACLNIINIELQMAPLSRAGFNEGGLRKGPVIVCSSEDVSIYSA
jgi:hypothetical protein